MKILIYGAGVIGTIYASKLQEIGHRVTVLARGERLAAIRQYGLVLEDILTGERSTAQADAVERLAPDDEYDLALITLRRDQLTSAITELMANETIPTMLFMLNNPVGSTNLAETIGRERLLLGFPGVGGSRDGFLLRYAMIAQQPTTLGELDGRRTTRLRNLTKVFGDAGFPVRMSDNMNAWLKTHAFFVTSVCGAIYLARGDCSRLSKDNATLRLMTQGVREGFVAMHALGFPVTPLSLKVLFSWLPQVVAVDYWRRFFASKTSDYIFGQHARSAPQEMRAIAGDCRILLNESGVEAPALQQLYLAIDAYADRK